MDKKKSITKEPEIDILETTSYLLYSVVENKLSRMSKNQKILDSKLNSILQILRKQK